MNSSTVGERLLALNGWALDDPPSITPFQFEQIDIFYWNGFVVRYAPKIGIFTATLYLLLIFSVQRWMKRKPAFQLKYSLFLWNTFMACFSILAVTRVTPPLFRLLFFSQEENGLYLSICAKKGINLPNILWALLFLASKIWELGDTLFLLLRKRPLKFIQWYHHLTTLVVCFTVAPYMEPIGRCYSTLNFFVHSFMYSYFALKSLGVAMPWWVARLVTTLQFVQMLIGLLVNFASYYIQYVLGYPCHRHRTSVVAFGIVYGSFVVLFGKLLLDGKRNKRKVIEDGKRE